MVKKDKSKKKRDIPEIIPEPLIRFLTEGTQYGREIVTPVINARIYSSTTTWHAAFEDEDHKWGYQGLFIPASDLHRARPTIFAYVMNCGKIVYLYVQFPDAGKYGSDIKKVAARLGIPYILTAGCEPGGVPLNMNSEPAGPNDELVKMVEYSSFGNILGYRIHHAVWIEADVHMRELILKNGDEKNSHYAKKPVD